MPEFQQAQQLQEFADEIFEVSKESWAAQSRTKSHADVTETEFLALDVLAHKNEPVTVGEIQRQIGVLPAQMSRVIRALETKGDKPLVECKINAHDKRKIDVSLTPVGLDAYRGYREQKLGSLQRMLEQLNEKDRSEFMRILRLIRGNMHKAMESK